MSHKGYQECSGFEDMFPLGSMHLPVSHAVRKSLMRITKENRKWRQVGTIPGAFSADYPTQVLFFKKKQSTSQIN